MAEKKGMGPTATTWTRPGLSRSGIDVAMLVALGALTYPLFRQAGGLGPLEGACLVVVAAGLLILGRRWWEWQMRLSRDGFLEDWARQILNGERAPRAIHGGLNPADLKVAEALNAVLAEALDRREELARLRYALEREWRDLDALLGSVERWHMQDAEARLRGVAQLNAIGKDLRTALEDTLRLEQLEMNHRLQADQHRLQGQAFGGALGQIRGSMEQFEELLQELQDTFPKLRREEDALGRLADAGLRQGARLTLAVKGLVAHTPRLVDETQARMEWLRRFRLAADEVRDQTEALARRIEAFREETQSRTRSFSAARGTMRGLDMVAQQTGLLAVNASILAQQEAGSTGMAAIGGRLRSLADQTAQGASDLERALDHHHLGLERETTGLWDLQEATERLLSGTHELLRMAGHLDQQGHDLERALETHLGMVDQVRQTSERVELSLHETGERSLGLEAALVRQWAVEAKLAPEQERFSRVGNRLGEVGEELVRISQASLDGAWAILQRHQDIRRTEAYRQITTEGTRELFPSVTGAEQAWARVAWARAERRARLAGAAAGTGPLRGADAEGRPWLLLLGQDALDLPEPSALESWSCDPTGRSWHLCLLEALRTEEYRLTLLEVIKRSALPACFPEVEVRISPDGVDLKLPTPYPGFPGFLAGLGLRLPIEPDALEQGTRPCVPRAMPVQHLMWVGPKAGGGRLHPGVRLVHAWIKDAPHHEVLLPWLPYEGHRPPCPLLEDQEELETLDVAMPLRCLGLGADDAGVHFLRDRLFQAGAMEGPGGVVLCAVGVGHAHPEALLLRLFQPDADLAGAFHPDLVPYQSRLRDEVLAGGSPDPYRAAWTILEDLQREGWLMPLPPG